MLKFRESASKYLSEEYEENLTVVVSGAKAEDADDVSGLVHIKLEKWMLQNLEGSSRRSRSRTTGFLKQGRDMVVPPVNPRR